MRLAGLRKTRLHVIIAATELLLGLCIYAYPTAFFAAGFMWVTRYVHWISSALVGSGALLLVLDQHRMHPVVYRLLSLIPALPMATFAAVAYIGAGWTAFIIYGLTTLALVVAWFCRRTDEERPGIDLWQVIFGLAQVLCGLTFAAAPHLYPTPPYAPLLPHMWLLGVAGVLGGSILLAASLLRSFRLPEAVVRVAGSIFPAFLVWSFFTAGYYTGVVAWGTWSLALLTGVGNLSLRAMTLRRTGVPNEDAGAVAVSIEKQLESWLWMLAFAVVGLNMATEHDNPRGMIPSTIFVLAISAYNAVVFRGLRGVGRIRLRIHSHLSFLAITVSLLLLHSSPIGHAFLALLAIIPSIGTRAKGKTEGYRLMGIAGFGVFASYALFGYRHHSLMETVMEVTLLSITSLVGLRLAADERQSAGALLERQAELEEALEQTRKADQARRQSEELFRFAFEGAPIGMALVDPKGQIRQVNGALCRMLGYTVDELMELGVPGVTHPEDLTVPLPVDFLSGESMSYQREKRYIHKDGHTVWGLLSLSRIGVGQGQMDYNISHVQDITERKSYERQLMHLASYDPLTDLFNRRRFQEELERQLAGAARNGEHGALMFIDLDQFKYVNDTLGHQAGDEFLRSVANVLRRQVRRGTDTIARLGGDEFAVILPGMDEGAARLAADQVLHTLRTHVQVLAGQSVSSTASVGVALYPEHGSSAADLLARADFAMYQAKEHGRNRSYLFRPDSDAVGQAENKLRWEQRIREALESDRMILYCQPIWDLRENRVSHHELLLRM
ncbi:MAG TPA: diguanylate cyclase, partial [Symbiobacteriaceae bacterium]|nr:diguanylate cyclase [Symbiobacteriaceae bacterium]